MALLPCDYLLVFLSDIVTILAMAEVVTISTPTVFNCTKVKEMNYFFLDGNVVMCVGHGKRDECFEYEVKPPNKIHFI